MPRSARVVIYLWFMLSVTVCNGGRPEEGYLLLYSFSPKHGAVLVTCVSAIYSNLVWFCDVRGAKGVSRESALTLNITYRGYVTYRLGLCVSGVLFLICFVQNGYHCDTDICF